ncbi:MAG: hypothetical protein JST81_02645 [Bacteroidetes bacterium]|nr:hypothetical protein [Bacteroidota bacterium]
MQDKKNHPQTGKPEQPNPDHLLPEWNEDSPMNDEPVPDPDYIPDEEDPYSEENYEAPEPGEGP